MAACSYFLGSTKYYFAAKLCATLCSSAVRIFLHTLLHTNNEHALSFIKGLFLVVFSHNPLVAGSSPARPLQIYRRLSIYLLQDATVWQSGI